MRASLWQASALLLVTTSVGTTEGEIGRQAQSRYTRLSLFASERVPDGGSRVSFNTRRTRPLPTFVAPVQPVRLSWSTRRRESSSCCSVALHATSMKEEQEKQQREEWPKRGDIDEDGVGPRKQSRISGPRTEQELQALRRIFEEEEKPAEPEGYEFFGGEAVKEELFDAEEEEEIVRQGVTALRDQTMSLPVESVEAATASVDGPYFRFDDKKSFPDELARNVGRGLQTLLNEALYDDDDGQAPRQLQDQPSVSYSPSMVWNTPLSKTRNTPIQELGESALSFYRRVDVAIIAAETVRDRVVQVRWEISVLWPNLWESRVLICGYSLVTLAEDDASTITILQQDDFLEDGDTGTDLFNILPEQVLPRFWDVYHIGMTPSAELVPRFRRSTGNPFAGFSVFEMPPRLVMNPSMDDTGGRENRIASAIPNHAFTTLIITTGPRRQRFAPSSPVEVRIVPKGGLSDPSVARVEWTIPVTPEFLACGYSPFATHDYGAVLPVPVASEDEERAQQVACRYKFQKRRLVATVPFSGQPQDDEVSEVRRKLYERVMKHKKYKPLLTQDGKPQFFFLQNDAKACFTADGGLGMAVYEFRFRWTRPNEIGIELELEDA